MPINRISGKSLSPSSGWIGVLSVFLLFNTYYLIIASQGIRTGEYSIIIVLLSALVEIALISMLVYILRSKANLFAKNDQVVPVDESLLVAEVKYETFASEVRNHNGSDSLKFVYIGGSSNSLEINSIIQLAAKRNRIVFHSVGDLTLHQLVIDDIISLSIDGPGTVTSDAGLSGGGFGLEGFIKGAVAATIINKITERRRTNTFLRIITGESELFLHTDSIEPLELRNLLSPLFVSLESRKHVAASAVNSSDQIAKLFTLKNQGALTEQEFDAAKKKILDL